MAADWIKLRMDLWDHPKVVRILSAMCPQNVRNVSGDFVLSSAKCQIIGAMFRTWSLFDKHSVDGILDGYTAESLDSEVGIKGWSLNLQHVGWLIVEPQRLIAPRFEEHNGESSKRRAEDARRKKLVRKMSAKCPQSVRETSANLRTREEKRREEKIESNPLPLLPPSLENDSFRKTLADWLAYKKKPYKPQGLQALVTRAATLAEQHGLEAVVNAFQRAMANGWAGWDQESSFAPQPAAVQRPLAITGIGDEPY